MGSSDKTSHAALFSITLLAALGVTNVARYLPNFVSASSSFSSFRYKQNALSYSMPFPLLSTIRGGDNKEEGIKNA